MKPTARVHYVLAHVVLAGVALQFLLAGLGIFRAMSLVPHFVVGYLVALFALLAYLASLVSGRARGWTLALLVALVIQIFLPEARRGAPAIAGLHVLNAGIVLFLAAAVFRGAPPSLRAVERADGPAGPGAAADEQAGTPAAGRGVGAGPATPEPGGSTAGRAGA